MDGCTGPVVQYDTWSWQIQTINSQARVCEHLCRMQSTRQADYAPETLASQVLKRALYSEDIAVSTMLVGDIHSSP